MPSKLPRLFVKSPLRTGAEIVLPPDQAHYLANVLRLKPQEQVLVFNGVDANGARAPPPRQEEGDARR
ncbi:RNA methyltransferase PUA domain-containing protein [Methyloceanibacter marginalis]|nr:RNA methyltransferase PUA domain-containing protein [Methyloceanibacter marginalis]